MENKGRVHPTGGGDAYAQHWVVVTGVSREWEYRDDRVYSPWNWVRIYNPFDNEEEYYPWKDFHSSWKNDGNMMIKFTRRDWSELHSVRE